MKQKILLLSHCFFNDAAKLRHQNSAKISTERNAKRSFLKEMLEQNIEFIQLPCPEFLLYGSNRWGHISSQFNTPHFRTESRKMLLPIVMQLEEYCAYPDRYEVLGILGIDGSPSCGVNHTWAGDWGGDVKESHVLSSALSTAKKVSKPGVFMEILKEMLHEKHLQINLYSLSTFTEMSRSPVQKDASQVDLSLYGHDKTEKRSPFPSSTLDGLNLL